jgi:hypothetical protein
MGYPSYGSWGYLKCPADHPYVIPAFTLGAWYPVVAGMHLSCDAMLPNSPAGTCWHADYWEAWNDKVKAMWTDNDINKAAQRFRGRSREWAAAEGQSLRSDALAVVAALVLSVVVHQHVAHKHLKAADAAGYARARTEDAKVLAEFKKRALTAEANGRQIAQEVRNRNETDNRNIHTAAADLRVHGAGAASCRRIDYPAIPAASGGHGAASRPADAAVAQVPSGEELFGLPIDGAVSFAEDHDLDRAEVLSWRVWYKLEAAELEKLRKK